MAKRGRIHFTDLLCEIGRGRSRPRAKFPSWACFVACAGHLLAPAEERLTLDLLVPVGGFASVFAAAAAPVCRDVLEPMAGAQRPRRVVRAFVDRGTMPTGITAKPQLRLFGYHGWDQ